MRAATAEISLMIPLSEHTDHKLLARLTTANSVIISSQETSGKSAVGNAALSVALLNFPYRFLCYIQVQDCPSTFLLELLVNYTDTAGIGSKNNVLADNDKRY